MRGDKIRVICAVCGKEYAAVVPKGGDGTELRPRSHMGFGSRCAGVWREGKIV